MTPFIKEPWTAAVASASQSITEGLKISLDAESGNDRGSSVLFAAVAAIGTLPLVDSGDGANCCGDSWTGLPIFVTKLEMGCWNPLTFLGDGNGSLGDTSC
jgi:hypothetical protein